MIKIETKMVKKFELPKILLDIPKNRSDCKSLFGDKIECFGIHCENCIFYLHNKDHLLELLIQINKEGYKQ